jgi:hypothetical protein
MNELRENLASRKAGPYERGLGMLGALLGFVVLDRDPRQKAAPDSVWTLENEIVLGWEAKSDEEPDRAIPIRNVRDTNGHFDWIRDHLKLPNDEPITVILSSPRSSIDTDARKFASRLRYAHVSEVENLANEVIATLSSVRRSTGAAGGEILRNELLNAFAKARLLPSDLRLRFKSLAEL